MPNASTLPQPLLASAQPSRQLSPATIGEPEACLDLQARPLASMPIFKVAVVEEVEGGDDDVARLKAMGLCAGRRLQLIKGGDPLIVRVLGSRIGISLRLAQGVRVRPCLLSGE